MWVSRQDGAEFHFRFFLAIQRCERHAALELRRGFRGWRQTCRKRIVMAVDNIVAPRQMQPGVGQRRINAQRRLKERDCGCELVAIEMKICEFEPGYGMRGHGFDRPLQDRHRLVRRGQRFAIGWFPADHIAFTNDLRGRAQGRR